MRIIHALSYETRAENISLLRFFLDRLYDKFEFEVIIPRGSGYEKLFCPTRVKITELGIEDKRGNMLRDVYIYKQYFRSSGARIVHSHGSVCASVGALSSSYREVSLISDFCTVGTLGRIFSSLAPRAKNTLTLGYLPSDISFFESRGVPKEKIVYVPLCTERRREGSWSF